VQGKVATAGCRHKCAITQVVATDTCRLGNKAGNGAGSPHAGSKEIAMRALTARRRNRRSGWRLVRRLFVIAWLVVHAGMPARAQRDFYSTDGIDLSSHAVGALTRSQPRVGAPDGAVAYRVLYRSQGLHREPIAVSGAVIVPWGPAPPGGRPIVAWAHPTNGIVPACAPSCARVLFESIQGLPEMLRRGFVVTATDYPGLGTAGPHPYLVGTSEGRAVLDSVRVALAASRLAAASRARTRSNRRAAVVRAIAVAVVIGDLCERFGDRLGEIAEAGNLRRIAVALLHFSGHFAHQIGGSAILSDLATVHAWLRLATGDMPQETPISTASSATSSSASAVG
jgi:hypothetical protein